MRLTLHLLGVEVFDFAVNEPTDSVEVDVEEHHGDALSTPINFTHPAIPWDADGPVHQFDPDESSEDY